ncbi:uncharacterized protein LOC114474863 [Gouania willdenowi]|uniref:Uncharacterized LOC114474863 n=1 Tax=Gouania willdenowi TaxID=441366 RepID=A0A8C5DU52_GOUWI|nr:uncharacterized protein LOC114474863 [Gouania willdenowi]
MQLKVVIFTLSFLTTSAYPLHRTTRDATLADSTANHVNEKTDITKNIDKIYKSSIDSYGLYDIDSSNSGNPLTVEMQHKLTMESERLRIRVRQELAELQGRLSSSPSHPSSTLASLRVRLSPLTQQLQNSLRSNTQDLCSQLKLYLQGLDLAEAEAKASPALYQEAFQWTSQTLAQSSSDVSNIITDFHSKAHGEIEHLKRSEMSEVYEEISSRLGEEVRLLKEETQNSVGALQERLVTLLESAHLPKAEVTHSVGQFCQNRSLQSEVVQARIERILMGLEAEEDVDDTSSLSGASPLSTQHRSSLQEDFSVKLSALIQDILQSVQ